MASDKQFKAFRELQKREKEFELQEAIKKRKETTAKLYRSDKPTRRVSRLGVKAVVGVMDRVRGESRGFSNVFSDPAFRYQEQEADGSEILRAGGICGLYDESGHKMKAQDSALGRRAINRMSSKLPYYSKLEIDEMNKKLTKKNDDETISSCAISEEESDNDSFCDGNGRTEGNYPPLRPLTDSSMSPQKLKGTVSGELVQLTLIKIWDILNVPTVRRVEFMAKYSTQSYFSSLQDAVNIWGQCATYCTARLALMTVCRNIQKNENIPVSTNSFLGIIEEVVGSTVSIPLLRNNVKKDEKSKAAEAYLQRRRSTFVRIEQPIDIKQGLKRVFTSALFLEHFNPTSSVLDMQARKEAEESVTAMSVSLEATKEKAIAFFKAIEHHIDSNLVSLNNIVSFLMYTMLFGKA